MAKQNETIANHYKETERLKCNELREKLVAQYRHFTSLEMNPRQEWTILDAETFWELFADYEKYGGNGFMHSTVKPAMEKIKSDFFLRRVLYTLLIFFDFFKNK